MTNIVKLDFRSRLGEPSKPGAGAQIVIFPGVRYERLEAPAKPAKPAKRPHSKSSPPLLRRG